MRPFALACASAPPLVRPLLLLSCPLSPPRVRLLLFLSRVFSPPRRIRSQVAAEGGFIAVVPNGIDNSWNAGGCCGTAMIENIDDVGCVRAAGLTWRTGGGWWTPGTAFGSSSTPARSSVDDLRPTGFPCLDMHRFIRALIAAVKTRVCVDDDAIFSGGMSNGAMLSLRAGCEISDLVSRAQQTAALVHAVLTRSLIILPPRSPPPSPPAPVLFPLPFSRSHLVRSERSVPLLASCLANVSSRATTRPSQCQSSYVQCACTLGMRDRWPTN